MRKSKKQPEVKPLAAAPRALRWWPWAAALAAMVVAFEAYGPAMSGEFVFDDRNAAFFSPNLTGDITAWIGRYRPATMFSWWVDYQIANGNDPARYHQTGLLLHLLTSLLAALIVWKLTEWAGVEGKMRAALAVISGGLFLLHPLQTESVIYVSERAEVLSVLFYYAAFALFLYKGEGSITIARSLAMMLLFAGALASKEHTLTLPLLILATDYFWNRGGLRRNFWMYLFFGIGGALGAAGVIWILRQSNTAGFNLRDMTPVAYFLTQCRVLWTYIRLFVFPAGQNVDPDVPVSHGILDHGAIFGLLALVALVAAAWMWRKKFPLASFGIVVFLLLVAPTSSVVPLTDVMAERRVYLPMIGLLLVCCEFLRRMDFKQAVSVGAAALVVCSVLTYRRAEVWSTSLSLWQDAVSKSPGKYRPRFQLAYAQYEQHRCSEAAKSYEAASGMAPVQPDLLVNWGLALDCAGDWQGAIARLNNALMFMNTAHVHTQIAGVYAKHEHIPEAVAQLNEAEKLDPSYDITYFYRGNLYQMAGNRAAAAAEYKRALALNPRNQPAQLALQQLGR